MREGWQTVKLGDVFETVTGNTPSKKNKEYYGEDVPLVKPPQLLNSSISDSDDKLSNAGAEVARVLPVDSILVSCIGNLGKIGINTVKVAFNQQINAILPHQSKAIPKYLFHLCLSPDFRSQLESKSSGTTVPIVNKSKFDSISIPLPPLPEQERIVSILDKAFEGIDKAIAQTEQNLASARELFESYLNNIFTQRGDGWVEKKLGDVCEKVEYGSSAKSSTEGKVPVLRMGNIQGGKFNWDKLVYTSNEEEITKYLLKHNDVLFNRTNSAALVGKTGIYKSEQPAIFAGYLIRIHLKKDLLDADFLNYYLNSWKARNYGETVMSKSVNQANISGSKLKTYPIVFPSLESQKEIVCALDNLKGQSQQLEALYTQKLNDLKELKQSLLQQAFAGELTKEDAA